MPKFLSIELQKAVFPMTAFQVVFRSHAPGSKPKPCIEAVSLTAYKAIFDQVHFTDSDGTASHCSPLNFHRSAKDAQDHIDFTYNWTPARQLMAA